MLFLELVGEKSIMRLAGGNLDKRCVNGTRKNVVWHKCSVQKIDRQNLLQQKGCVIWIDLFLDSRLMVNRGYPPQQLLL